MEVLELSVVDEVRKQIHNRLRELEPLVAEFRQLEELAKSIGGRVTARSATTTSTRTATRRGSTGTRRASTGTRRGRGAGRRTATASSAGTTRATSTRRGRSTQRKRATGSSRSNGQTRGTQALELVKARPGITIPELATEMGIKQNYLYRVMPSLEASKQVTKQGKGWFPAS